MFSVNNSACCAVRLKDNWDNVPQVCLVPSQALCEEHVGDVVVPEVLPELLVIMAVKSTS